MSLLMRTRGNKRSMLLLAKLMALQPLMLICGDLGVYCRMNVSLSEAKQSEIRLSSTPKYDKMGNQKQK